ncbi:hypothetical protein GCM10023097_19680 [Streptomyces collinus]
MLSAIVTPKTTAAASTWASVVRTTRVTTPAPGILPYTPKYEAGSAARIAATAPPATCHTFRSIRCGLSVTLRSDSGDYMKFPTFKITERGKGGS